MGKLFTGKVGKLLTRLLGNYLTAALGKVLDIYKVPGREASWTLSLSISGFWSKPATHSGEKLPPIIEQTCHPFWLKVYHFLGKYQNDQEHSL